jgi:phenylpyruvate tautomerase PptA (4-oxalocrotonate tautomerase family)
MGDPKVPLYTITTQAGLLNSDDKAALATQLTELHCEFSGVPANWIHIVFHEYSIGSGFTAGRPAATAALTLLMRTGHSSEYKRSLLARLWPLFQNATGAENDQIVIGIQEVSPSQAMEMGQIMPEVA